MWTYTPNGSGLTVAMLPLAGARTDGVGRRGGLRAAPRGRDLPGGGTGVPGRARARRPIPGRFHAATRRRRVRRTALATTVGAGRVGDRAAGDRRGAPSRGRAETDEPDRDRLGGSHA